jgi:hypothetical protein
MNFEPGIWKAAETTEMGPIDIATAEERVIRSKRLSTLATGFDT